MADLTYFVSGYGWEIARGAKMALMLQALGASNPVLQITAAIPTQYPDDSIRFISGNSTMPNMAIMYDRLHMVILIGGAYQSSQIANFVAGVEAGVDVRDNLGSVSALYVLAQQVHSQTFGSGGVSGKDVVIAGHSLGGAIAQVYGAYLSGLGLARSIRMITFGGPRPGGALLASRLQHMDNNRWINDGDLVPFLPPHADEVPAMLLVSPISLWRGANGLVQGPVGQKVDSTGRVTADMGNPPSNWGFLLSLYQYMQNLMVGGAGPHHSIGEYYTNLLAAVARYPTPLTRPVQQPQIPLIQRPRERMATIAIGRAEIFTDATSPTGETRTYAPLPRLDPAGPVYKAGRDGRAWVIKYGDYTVGAATGKRDARRIARAWNRAARATAR